jgi:exopolyphosphatase/guanosine-5'-triphosphate,3'-diphosphate pyrophosphatase
MAAILRLAVYLERGRNSNITDVIITWDENQLRITLIANQYPTVELWQANRNALPLMEEVYQKGVTMTDFLPLKTA